MGNICSITARDAKAERLEAQDRALECIAQPLPVSPKVKHSRVTSWLRRAPPNLNKPLPPSPRPETVSRESSGHWQVGEEGKVEQADAKSDAHTLKDNQEVRASRHGEVFLCHCNACRDHPLFERMCSQVRLSLQQPKQDQPQNKTERVTRSSWLSTRLIQLRNDKKIR